MPGDARETETIAGAALPIATVRECRLVEIVDGRDHATHVFARERIVVGADASCDIVLADPALSKFHCELRIVEGTAFVRDLHSRNGTFVDRVAVLDAPLHSGATLTLGRTHLRFDLGARQVALPTSSRDRFGRLRGTSLAMRSAFQLLEAAAASTTTVLVQGESGTGKELAAEAIHLEGARRDAPFVVVDCGSIPAGLLEAELFGSEAGAFTGATTRRIGAFEAASGGTVFLDEIGELALDLQPKLLRVLDRREVMRLGSSERIPVDVRIIAATNRDLRAEVNAKRFRSDLYFRLGVLVVTMPPLRDRTSDIPMLVDAILESLGDRTSPMARSLLGGTVLPELVRHGWPGNVRELRNYLEGALARQDATLAPSDHAPVIDLALPLRVVRDRFVRHIERQYLEALLAAHGGNVSAAARAAGVDRVHLHRLLKSAGLR